MPGQSTATLKHQPRLRVDVAHSLSDLTHSSLRLLLLQAEVKYL